MLSFIISHFFLARFNLCFINDFDKEGESFEDRPMDEDIDELIEEPQIKEYETNCDNNDGFIGDRKVFSFILNGLN